MDGRPRLPSTRMPSRPGELHPEPLTDPALWTSVISGASDFRFLAHDLAASRSSPRNSNDEGRPCVSHRVARSASRVCSHDDPDRPLVCVDETSKQLIAETRVPIPMKPGRPGRFDYEYERNGTANLFMRGAELTDQACLEVDGAVRQGSGIRPMVQSAYRR